MEVKRTTKGPYLPMEGMLRTSGLCLEVQSRSAAMKRTTFFSCSKCCSRSCVHLTWRKGQSRLGRFGMPGIGSTLSRYRHTRSIFLTAQWDYWKKRISTPKCSAYSVSRKEYFCQFCFSWDITVFIQLLVYPPTLEFSSYTCTYMFTLLFNKTFYCFSLKKKRKKKKISEDISISLYIRVD